MYICFKKNKKHLPTNYVVSPKKPSPCELLQELPCRSDSKQRGLPCLPINKQAHRDESRSRKGPALSFHLSKKGKMHSPTRRNYIETKGEVTSAVIGTCQYPQVKSLKEIQAQFILLHFTCSLYFTKFKARLFFYQQKRFWN